MAHFGKPQGESTFGFDASARLQVTHVGASTPLALFDGDGLVVAVGDSGIATLDETPTGTPGLRGFVLSGVTPGTTTLDARDGSGTLLASLEIQVNADLTDAEISADFQITDEHRARLTPQEIKNLEEDIRDMRFNPMPQGKAKISERYSMDGLVKDGKDRPTNWGSKKGR